VTGFVFDQRGAEPEKKLAIRLADLLGCGREEIMRVGERARTMAAEFATETVAQRYLEDFVSLLAPRRSADEMSDLSLTND
jgi:hypothetical protein